MKKIVHATQMFALIAMFPVIVILELNHTTPTSSEIDSPSKFLEKTIKGTTGAPKNSDAKIVADAFNRQYKHHLQPTI